MTSSMIPHVVQTSRDATYGTRRERVFAQMLRIVWRSCSLDRLVIRSYPAIGESDSHTKNMCFFLALPESEESLQRRVIRRRRLRWSVTLLSDKFWRDVRVRRPRYIASCFGSFVHGHVLDPHQITHGKSAKGKTQASGHRIW